MAKTDSDLVINIDTGVITFRNAENDEHCNCFPIKREHAAMVENGELDVGVLVAAIKRHLAKETDFNFDNYIAERMKLNVRKTALRVDAPKPELKDRTDEMVSDADIAAVKKEATDSGKKKTAKKQSVVDEAVGAAKEVVL